MAQNTQMNIVVTASELPKDITFNKLDLAIEFRHLTRTVCTDATIMVNGIPMPTLDDEKFFYASVEAAEEEKVWCEELHMFVTRTWLSEFEGGCFDTYDEEDIAQFWAEAVLNVRSDIDGYTDHTGKDGEAIVKDADLVYMCEKDGLLVEEGYDGCYYEYDPDFEPYWVVRKDPLEDLFSYDENTHEHLFEGQFVHGYLYEYDPDLEPYSDGAAQFFCMKDGKPVAYTLPTVEITYDRWSYICKSIEKNPSDWWIEEYSFSGADGGILIHDLGYMPNDINGIHATGREYLEVNGDLVAEYEDDLTEVVHRYSFGESVE